jgi:hypothetical protein
MLTRRKKKSATPAFQMAREYKLRLPPDVSKWVEQRAKDTGWPQNRVIINSLVSLDYLEKLRGIGELYEDMKVWNARQSARVTWLDLSHELLNAVDAVLKTEGSAREAAIDRLRVERTAMLKSSKIEQTAKK